jgi:hypothetical protein
MLKACERVFKTRPSDQACLTTLGKTTLGNQLITPQSKVADALASELPLILQSIKKIPGLIKLVPQTLLALPVPDER